jgi:hypothetical protein
MSETGLHLRERIVLFVHSSTVATIVGASLARHDEERRLLFFDSYGRGEELDDAALSLETKPLVILCFFPYRVARLSEIIEKSCHSRGMTKKERVGGMGCEHKHARRSFT